MLLVLLLLLVSVHLDCRRLEGLDDIEELSKVGGMLDFDGSDHEEEE